MQESVEPEHVKQLTEHAWHVFWIEVYPSAHERHDWEFNGLVQPLHDGEHCRHPIPETKIYLSTRQDPVHVDTEEVEHN